MKNCIIIGGGLCGLFSSIVLADKFDHVSVIEFDKNCGGLLKSVHDDAGVVYDQGTHIPNTTDIPEIDDILFGPEQQRHQHWNELGALKTGNFFAGQWDLSTQITDTRNLAQAEYERGIVELLSRTQQSTAPDIVTYLTETIGPTFTNAIAIPLLKKLYGEKVDLSELMTNSSVSYFGLSRVLALSPQVSKKLKEIPAFDDKLAYHNQEDFEQRMKKDGIKDPIHYYPKSKPGKSQGVQLWIEHLVNQAKAKGVEFYHQETVETIHHQRQHITSVTLKNSKQTLPCDFLYWSAPPAIALKAAGLQSHKSKPHFKTANIFHFTFDRPINNTESYYVWNWDVTAKSFRVTLFPNLRLDDNDSGIYNLSIEALSDVDDADTITVELMLSELRQMKLIDDDAKVLSSLRQTIHNTFPVPTFAFGEATENNFQKLNNSFDNIMVSGRFSGKQWFHGDIITSAWHNIQQRFVG